MKFGKKILAAAAYLFGIPALYIILTEKRYQPLLGWHGTQALRLWLAYFAFFFALRFLVNLIWSVYYLPFLAIIENLAVAVMAGYACWRGYRVLITNP